MYLAAESSNSNPSSGVYLESAQVILFRQAQFVGVNGTWTRPNVYELSSLPAGYDGLLWKETLTPDWTMRIDGGPMSMNHLLYAGPQLIYVPLRHQSQGAGLGVQFVQNVSGGQILGSIISVFSIFIVAVFLTFGKKLKRIGSYVRSRARVLRAKMITRKRC